MVTKYLFCITHAVLIMPILIIVEPLACLILSFALFHINSQQEEMCKAFLYFSKGYLQNLRNSLSIWSQTGFG